MPFNTKLAAESLLKIADAIEKQASLQSFFVCNKCNHTSNLATINDTRRKVASEHNRNSVSKITIHDKIACPACAGTMEYVPTEESEKYYIEVDAADDTGIPMEPVPADTDTGREAPMPPMKKKPPTPTPEGTPAPEGEPAPEEGAVPEEAPASEGEPVPEGEGEPAPTEAPAPAPEGEPAPVEEEPTSEEPTSEEAPAEGVPEEAPAEDTSEEPDSIFEPVDEQQKKIEDQKEMENAPPEDESVEEAPAEEVEDLPSKEDETPSEDKADDKKAVPKFTEMPEDIKEMTEKQQKKGPGRPKQASERFWSSVARYTSN